MYRQDKNGEFKEYYDNGKLIEESKCSNGLISEQTLYKDD